MIMRYKLTVSYDGSDFYGFQRQRGLISVQECLEEALSTKLNEPVTIACAGRTDAGVHALGQVVHFDHDGELPADFNFRINPLLPESIAVLSCERVPDSFHARFSAKRKTYRYDIYLSKIHAPLKRRYAHICVYELNVENMKKACACLVGEHDFRSFALAESVRGKSTVRTIYDIHIEESEGGRLLSLYVTGDPRRYAGYFGQQGPPPRRQNGGRLRTVPCKRGILSAYSVKKSVIFTILMPLKLVEKVLSAVIITFS